MQSTIKLGSCLASGAFLLAPHPCTLIQQQCGRYLQKADATCAQSNAFQAHVITSRTFIGTGIHATMCDLHISQRMTAPSPASTHSRSAQPGATGRVPNAGPGQGLRMTKSASSCQNFATACCFACINNCCRACCCCAASCCSNTTLWCSLFCWRCCSK